MLLISIVNSVEMYLVEGAFLLNFTRIEKIEIRNNNYL